MPSRFQAWNQATTLAVEFRLALLLQVPERGTQEGRRIDCEEGTKLGQRVECVQLKFGSQNNGMMSVCEKRFYIPSSSRLNGE